MGIEGWLWRRRRRRFHRKDRGCPRLCPELNPRARETRTWSSWVTESTSLAGPTLARVSVLNYLRFPLLVFLGPRGAQLENLDFFNMVMLHALRIPCIHPGVSNTWTLKPFRDSSLRAFLLQLSWQACQSVCIKSTKECHCGDASILLHVSALCTQSGVVVLQKQFSRYRCSIIVGGLRIGKRSTCVGRIAYSSVERRWSKEPKMEIIDSVMLWLLPMLSRMNYARTKQPACEADELLSMFFST